MKRHCFIICFIIPLALTAQNKLNSIPEDSIPKIRELQTASYADWSKIDSAWMAGEYWNILKDFKLKMSCAHCEDILMHVDLNIDSEGKLLEHRMVRSNKCGMEFDKKLEDAFMNYFYTITFPLTLRNRIFRVMLGTGLKC